MPILFSMVLTCFHPSSCYIPLGNFFFFHKTQEDIKHIILIKVLRGV